MKRAKVRSRRRFGDIDVNSAIAVGIGSSVSVVVNTIDVKMAKPSPTASTLRARPSRWLLHSFELRFELRFEFFPSFYFAVVLFL